MSILRTAMVLLILAASALPACGQEGSIRFFDLRSQEQSAFGRILPELGKAELVLLGELHGDARSHQVQLEVIRGMVESGVGIAVGLEMFQHRDQAMLDRWVQGEIPEEEFRSVFQRNWGYGWDSYREIFLYCRERKVPMVGVNVPREITRQVAAYGFDSLSSEQLGQLPPVSCSVDPKYRELLKRTLGAHGNAHAHGMDFESFCEAQVLWDTAMAYYAREYLGRNSGKTMILLCGAVHAWRPAIPAQFDRLSETRRAQVVFLPRKGGSIARGDVTAEDADFLFE
jgi:uncharacterized iron-regulated protein